MNFLDKIKRKVKIKFNDPICIFVNHQISALFNPEIDCRSDWSSLDLFQKNVDWIKKDFTVVSLFDAVNILEKNKRIKERFAVFTFDDGYASVKNALEILTENDLPATIFISSAYLGDKTLSSVNAVNYINSKCLKDTADYPESFLSAVRNIDKCNKKEDYKKYTNIIKDNLYLFKPSTPIYMSEIDLKSLNSELFTLALHGHEHYNSELIDDDLFETNLLENYCSLKGYSNLKLFFAFPYGTGNKNKIVKVRNMGYIPFLCNGLKCYGKSEAYNRIPIDGIDVSKILL